MTTIPFPVQRGRAGRSRWDAIVVGSGVGGTAAAALLAHAGQRVLVLEKNRALGGILASYERDGFKVDTGSHLVPRGAHGPLGGVLRTLGLTAPRFLVHRVPVRSRGMFDIAAPASRLGLWRTAREAVRLLRIPRADVRALLRLGMRVATMGPRTLREWDRTTLDDLVRSYTDNPQAYFLFSFLASIFFVLPPWEVSAGEAALTLRALLRDYALSYVEGGMDAWSHAVLSRVPAAGGEVVVEARVTAIARAPGGRLRVVTSGGDEYEAPAVACNLAPSDLVALVEPAALPRDWVERVRAIRPSGNAFQIKVALRRPLVEEGCIIGGISLRGSTTADLTHADMRRVVEDLDAGRITDPLPVYAPVPTNFDPSLAPPGRQLIVASVYGSSREVLADPIERWRDVCLRALARAVPGLEDELLWWEFVPIAALGAWMGKSSRAAICNGQRPGQVGRDRLPVRTPVPGLWLCGDGAGGRGIGTELAAASGVEVAREVRAWKP